jgi:SAM-dependent methyltransferase
MIDNKLSSWLRENLCCPRDRRALTITGNALICTLGHLYPIRDGIPIMLLKEEPDTDPVFAESLEYGTPGAYTDRRNANLLKPGEVDHLVQRLVAGSCGQMYRPLIGKLTRYPVPHLRLKLSNGSQMLDVGCAWGRWSLAAARSGYRAVGIDPSIYNIFAARRIAHQLGFTENIYIVADGRYLPFVDGCFDAAFSYSCLQHMSEGDVENVLYEIRRVLKPTGVSFVEMPNRWGLRNLYLQARRGFQPPRYTDVRYWRPKDLKSTFSRCIGPTRLSIDGFFTINPQRSDLDLLPLRYKAVVLVSEALRHIGAIVPALKYIADSIYVTSVPAETSRHG